MTRRCATSQGTTIAPRRWQAGPEQPLRPAARAAKPLHPGPLSFPAPPRPLPRRAGVGPGSFPAGFSEAPLQWHYLGQTIAMKMVGGFFGVQQDPATSALLPAIGWAVMPAETTAHLCGGVGGGHSRFG